jgi:hypothetical protein
MFCGIFSPLWEETKEILKNRLEKKNKTSFKNINGKIKVKKEKKILNHHQKHLTKNTLYLNTKTHNILEKYFSLQL